MQTITTTADMRAAADQWRAAGRTIALVPTMGALHAGQEALIRAAAAKADIVVAVCFVNPLQFAPNELIANYPRSREEDAALCERCGAAAIFVPSAEEIYPKGFSTYVTEETLSKPLCGPSRPAHFRGVTTLMAMLFNLVRPQYAFFGQKTAQRAAIVRKMAADLRFEVEVIVVPTVRDADGLAHGVRNREFTASQRQEALALSKSLIKAREMAAAGVRSPDRIIAEATHIISQHRRVRIIYVAIVDHLTMEPMREVVPGQSMLAIAAWVDEVRIIDNTML
ncbi:MAG TPA: pantoate--beta-alanine ligase [Opitutaceae bacterium]|nr:pantoate--beta-alanine ligase [Opitutaceae bacterium]